MNIINPRFPDKGVVVLNGIPFWRPKESGIYYVSEFSNVTDSDIYKYYADCYRQGSIVAAGLSRTPRFDKMLERIHYMSRIEKDNIQYNGCNPIFSYANFGITVFGQNVILDDTKEYQLDFLIVIDCINRIIRHSREFNCEYHDDYDRSIRKHFIQQEFSNLVAYWYVSRLEHYYIWDEKWDNQIITIDLSMGFVPFRISCRIKEFQDLEIVKSLKNFYSTY